MHIAELLVGRDASIRSALSVIDKQCAERAFVVDRQGRLVGTIGEAEIRRAILDGTSLGAPVYPLMTRPGIAAKPETSRAEALDLMHAFGITEMPIVDERGVVVGMHAKNELVGVEKLDNWAVIMAGGRGTRLAPLTNTIPKPMLPVAGRPIIERLVLHLVGSGITRIFISVNYLGKMIEDHFGDGSGFCCDIEYLREDPDVPLGTGGSLRLIGELGYEPAEPLIVMNGDLVTGFSVRDLLDTHESQNAVATIAVSEYRHQVPFGVLESEDGLVSRIVEKPTPSWPVNAGIYAVEPKLLSDIPEGKLFPITALFDDCLSSGWTVAVWPLGDGWQDIGRPDELAKARGQL